MRKSTAVQVGVGLGVLFVLYRLGKKTEAAIQQAARPMNGIGNLLKPSPNDGEWISKGGPLYGLGEAPGIPQYRSRVLNDFFPGLGDRARSEIQRQNKARAAQAVKDKAAAEAALRAKIQAEIAAAKPVETIEYRDSKGNVISKAQYEAMMSAPQVQTRPALPPPPNALQSAAQQTQQVYNAESAAREQASIRDGGSDDYGSAASPLTSYGTAQTASPAGSPAMPAAVAPASIETPSAMMLPAEAPQQKGGLMPWLVGGGLVAAVVAANA